MIGWATALLISTVMQQQSPNIGSLNGTSPIISNIVEGPHTASPEIARAWCDGFIAGSHSLWPADATIVIKLIGGGEVSCSLKETK